MLAIVEANSSWPRYLLVSDIIDYLNTYPIVCIAMILKPCDFVVAVFDKLLYI